MKNINWNYKYMPVKTIDVYDLPKKKFSTSFLEAGDLIADEKEKSLDDTVVRIRIETKDLLSDKELEVSQNIA